MKPQRHIRHTTGKRKSVLPVIAQRQVRDVFQSLETCWTNSADVVPCDKQIPRISRDPLRDGLQLFGHTLDRVSRFGTFAAGRTRCARVNGTHQCTQNHAWCQFQHFGEKATVCNANK